MIYGIRAPCRDIRLGIIKPMWHAVIVLIFLNHQQRMEKGAAGPRPTRWDHIMQQGISLRVTN